MGRVRGWVLPVVAGTVLAGGCALPAGDGHGPANAGTGDRTGGVAHAGVAMAGRAGVAGTTLFEVDATATPVSTPNGDSIPVAISRDAALAAARTGTLAVVLPDGTRYPVRHERSESSPDGNWTFIGRVDTSAGALASVVTFGPDGVFGTLPTPDGGTMKFTTRAGQVFLQPAGWSVPPGVDPSQHPDYVMAPPQPSAPVAMGGATSARLITQRAEATGGDVTISILAVYTRNLSLLRGSAAAAQTEYRNLVAVMNQAHVDSGTRARFAIAGFKEVDYPAEAWNSDARTDIIENTLPDGTDLHALRDQEAADLVALIRPYVDGDLTCGISQFPGGELQSHGFSGDSGFSVTAVEACAPLVFAHEIGHNLGLMHDRDTVAGPHGGTLSYGAYPFSFGHRQLGPPGFATVMAYDSESRPRLGVFSHPGGTLCNGVACGDAALSDNVRSINLIADAISRFRDPPGVISIGDGVAYEYSGDHTHYLPVTLSSPAPAGGVTFDVTVEAGSAQLGIDADVAPGFRLDGLVIPEGSMYASVPIVVHADDVAEPTEAIGLRLRNVRGSIAVLDDAATLSIVDFDETVRLQGTVRFPPGATGLPGYARMVVKARKGGLYDEYSAYAPAPDYRFTLDVPVGSHVSIGETLDGFAMQDVIFEDVVRPMDGIDLWPREAVGFSGRLLDAYGRGVSGVPVILWNPDGDGGGWYANYPDYLAAYARDVLPGVSMQLEVRDPPSPYVRQVVEVPPLQQASALDVRLRTVPSLTIPHVTLPEGTGADGARTVLLTASLSVPRTKTGVSFDIELAGTAGADDFHLPKTHFSIPVLRSRIEVPIVIVGDDRSEPDETVELRITNVQGAAWNPGPGSVRIATDDKRPGDGRCTGSTEGGGVRMCQ